MTENMSSMVVTLLIWLGLTSFIAAENSLKQVVVITRHGSRELLTKDHKTFVEGGDSPLTIRGMDQMFRAGKFVGRHYGNSTFMSAVYSSQDIYVRSSDYSRTLNSALSFLLGFYPPVNQTLNVSYVGVFNAPYNIQQVPIHSVAVENDQVLRGWLNCPVLQERLTNFFKSSKFKKKEAESAALRKELELITGIEKIELKNFYNVYDYIHLHRLYNHTHLNITNEQWEKVLYLAHWIEYHKYSRKMIGSIGGGLLANEIVSSFKKVAANESNVKMLYYSAHYPTMFSLFSALGLNEPQDSPFRMLPNYASMVFFELLRSSSDKKTFVQLSFKNGLEEPLQNYSIPRCGDPCPLDDFVKLVNSLAVRDVGTWCNACKNTNLSSCRFPSNTPYSPKAKEPSLSGTGGFFVGVFVTLLFVILLLSAWHFCLRERCLTNYRQRPRTGLSEMEYGRNTGVI